jgi:hypothetical protein
MSTRQPLVGLGLTMLAAISAAVALTVCPPARAAAIPAPSATAGSSPLHAADATPAARYAIVVQDDVALRAAPHERAPQQATLWQGDLLELRGERLGFLQVYDHRRERGGYLRPAQVRIVSLAPDAAPQLLAVLRFLRDTPGAESLGIAYAAAYLKAAPAQAIDGEPFDALGTMAERLAARASARRPAARDDAIAAQLDVAAAYGVNIRSVERGDGHVQLCYDGEAFHQVLALPASPEARARAALALTRDDCIAPGLPPLQRDQLDHARAALLDRIDLHALPPALKNRVEMRRAGIWAALAFDRTRRSDEHAPSEAAERSLDALARVDKNELTDDDQRDYNDAAIRVNASRWAAQPLPAAGATRKLAIAALPGEPGQTCVALIDAKHDAIHPLMQRCTYGTVWPQSMSINAAGTALAVAVQPLPGWRELWVFHRGPQGWVADVVAPADGEPGLGVIEFAGWVPDGKHLLAAREARIEGRWERRFELLRLDTLSTEKQAERPEWLSAFYRWQDAAWKRETPMLR